MKTKRIIKILIILFVGMFFSLVFNFLFSTPSDYITANKTIENNFSVYFHINEDILSLVVLKNHPFWECQRKLARKLLSELIKD